jgi:hypothetical protein
MTTIMPVGLELLSIAGVAPRLIGALAGRQR